MKKHFLPESFDFGMPSVELIGVGTKGLDKTAMVKRASAFDDVIGDLKKKPNREYLHVITTGAFEKYGANQNGDGWNGEAYEIEFPHPEDPKRKKAMLDGGLSKYHDDTYMKNGAVYQEHKTKRAGVDPSGEVVAARYNPIMKRGELIISVDTNKWASRLQKKAQGKNIFLSIGADVPHDMCFPKGTLILTDQGYMPIEDIEVGTVVHTQQGNWKPVVALSNSESSIMTSFKSTCMADELTCTPNHPIYAAVGNEDISCEKMPELSFDFVPADSLTLNSVLKIKLDPCVPLTKTEPVSFDNCMHLKRVGQSIYAAYTDADIMEMFQKTMTERLYFLAGCMEAKTPENRRANKHKYILGVANRGTALLLQRLFWSIGILAVCTEDLGYMFSVDRPTENFKTLIRVADNLCKYRGEQAPPFPYDDLGDLYIQDGFAYMKVMGIDRYKTGGTDVYNFEIADDNTYNAEGIDVHNCNICGRIAKTASQHCDHFKKHRGQVYDSGVRACVMNDSPSFYDISGVDVPADQIAFVLSKVASGVTAKEAALEVLSVCTPRRPMLYTKAAAILDKLSKMEKQLVGMVEGDKQEPAFHDDDEAAKDFILKVENFPSDEIIDSCNRKGILLSPGMLFKIMGKDCTEDSDKEMLCGLEDDCCGDCSTMFEDMEEDECCNEELLDGSFDEHLPADLSLDDILEKFVPEFGVTQPAMQGKIITVTITGRKGKEPKQESKEASLNKQAQEALRRTYARYVISFAERNDDATCYNALRKIAVYGK